MTAAEYFSELIDQIPEAKPGKMFGSVCAKMPNGKAGMMLKNQDLIVKIPAKMAEKEKFEVFTPMENRPMNGWFVIPFERKKDWKKFAEISCSEAAKLPPNPKKK